MSHVCLGIFFFLFTVMFQIEWYNNGSKCNRETGELQKDIKGSRTRIQFNMIEHFHFETISTEDEKNNPWWRHIYIYYTYCSIIYKKRYRNNQSAHQQMKRIISCQYYSAKVRKSYHRWQHGWTSKGTELSEISHRERR